MHLIATELSMFNEIRVIETTELYGELGKFRCLQFADEAIQGAMDLKDTKRVVLQYQRAMLHLLELLNPSFERAFVIGHGIGTIAGHYPDIKMTVAELDGKVVELSKQFFGYRHNNVIVGDGREILSHEQSNQFDFIILDAFNSKGTPLHFTTHEFFELMLDKLDSSGAIMMNLFGKIKNDRLINAIHTTLKETYTFIRVFTLPAAHESDERNMIVIGSNKPIDFHVRGDKVGFECIEVELEQGHTIRDRVVE
ncbi:spermidine synthase [Cohnella sp. WQ 127256]|uniref:spermidine synthase n=1 Tax=Cohnella sp. WQ 127256 TaxID=2938790 RepID=UPI0021199996|nr:fused MFS/spermidine synthase [Cohnella sp. WQ 127256]